MTVNNSANKVIAAGNGVQTVFNFGFIAVAASDLEVILTDVSGNETTLLPANYAVALNPVPAGQIWSLGGTVTYPLVGSPIPTGSTLTIVRELSLTQLVALGNQGNEFPSAVETALDLIEMQLQQVNETFQRAIVAPVVDPTAPLPLPPAAQRANMGMAFDGNGNPIAAALPASGVISSAMQPVVDAASLALGRTAFGLGSAATEAIGSYGLVDDGSGNLRQNIVTVADATNQNVDKTFHLTQRIATGPLNYTLPRANTLWDGFAMWIFASSGNITITPNANDQFGALAAGTAISVPQGSWCFLTTNAASSGTWYANYNGENLSLSASVSASALTIALTATSLKFRDPTLANGDPLLANVPSSCSITVPNGATLGSSNNVACRVWVFVAYNNGSPVLGVATATALGAATPQIFPIAALETQQNTAAQISAASDSAGVLYTSAAIAADAVRLLGYVQFSAGQASAGVWNTAPSKVQLLGPGVKRPGDLVQAAHATITPTSPANLIKVSATQAWNTQTAGNTTVTLTRGATTIASTTVTQASSGATGTIGFTPVLDAPNSISALTYVLGAATGNSAGTLYITTEEIMG